MKYSCSRLWILVLAVLVPSSAGAQSAASVMRARLAADSVAAAMLRDSVAGVVIGAFRSAEPLFIAAHGLADLQSARPLRSDEPLPIGSITKQFAAVAVLALAEEQHLTLDDPITRHLGELGDGFRELTIRQLLHQTSGVGRYEGAFQAAPPGSAEAVVRVIGAATNEFAPGARFAYNNANYYLLGALIERVTGQPWHEFLRVRFLEPLGMTRTGLCRDGGPDSAATGYLIFGRRVDRPAIPAVMTGAAGALCSTVTDLGTWSHALHSGRLLTPAWTRLLSTPPQLPGAQQAAYGMGAVVSDLDRHRELWHNGGLTSGFSAMLAYYPHDSLTVVVLANSFPARPEPAARAIARAWFGSTPAVAAAPVGPGAGSSLPLSAYAGVYAVGPLRFTVTVSGEGLAMVDPNGSQIPLQPVAGHAFVSASDSTFRVTFDVTDGRATQLRIDSPRAQAPPAPRIADSP